MTTQPPEALARLLTDAEAAHGVYEQAALGGVYDQDWPRWYATWAVAHGIGPLVGREIDADDLAGLLTRAWAEFSALDPRPEEPWVRWTALWLLRELP